MNPELGISTTMLSCPSIRKKEVETYKQTVGQDKVHD